jgi:hypothetical protein
MDETRETNQVSNSLISNDETLFYDEKALLNDLFPQIVPTIQETNMAPLPSIYLLCSDAPNFTAPQFHGAFYSMEDLETALWMRIGRRMGAHRPQVYADATEQCQALEPNTSVSFSGDEDGTTWYHVYRYEAWNEHPTIHMVVARDADRYVTFNYVGPFAEEAQNAAAGAVPGTFTRYSVRGHTE